MKSESKKSKSSKDKAPEGEDSRSESSPALISQRGASLLENEVESVVPATRSQNLLLK